MFSFADFFGDDIELEGGNPVFTVAHRTTKTVDKFLSDLKTSLDYCRACYCLVFSDKTKEMNSEVLTDACPAGLPFELPSGAIVVCSKCNTQISKCQWPTWAYTNDLQPDDIPIELAKLTPNEVRTVSLICPFLKVIILPGGQFGEEGSVIHFLSLYSM